MASKPLTTEEIESILMHLGNERDRLLFLLGIHTGFRISELLSLTLSDVTEYGAVRESITVRRAHMKGKGSSRTIPLHNRAREALGAYITPGMRPEVRLFDISRVQAHRILKRSVVLAQIKGSVSTHSMRKTFGQKVYKATGNNVVAAQRALGHKSLSSTTHYLSVGDDVILKAVMGD